MNEWWKLIQTALCVIPIGAIVLLFVKAWMTDTRTRIEKATPKSECLIHTEYFEKELTKMNREVKQSFDKLIEKMDEHKQDYNNVTIELAKLTQRVDDFLRNGNKKSEVR